MSTKIKILNFPIESGPLSPSIGNPGKQHNFKIPNITVRKLFCVFVFVLVFLVCSFTCFKI